MQRAIISDTSCLILLHKINELELLRKLFGEVLITEEVAEEFGLALPDWFKIKIPADSAYQIRIENLVDKGEASAIALAAKMSNALLIIDDLKGRRLAARLGIDIVGTAGIIAEAKISGILLSVKPVLQKIKETNFRISESLELHIIKLAGEE